MVEEFVVYVLYSRKYDKIYIGYTSNLLERFKSHNYLGKKGFTIKYRPWEVVYVSFHHKKSAALIAEKGLKSGVGRRFIWEEVLKRETN